MCLIGEEGGCDMWLVGLLACDIIMLGLVTVVNVSLAAAILHRRHSLFATHPATFTFVLSMCLADLAVAAAGCYYRVFTYFCHAKSVLSRSKMACLARFSIMVTAYLASSFSLLLLAIDRYCAVVHALRYHQILSQRRSSLTVAGVWLLAVAISAVLFVWNHWVPHQPCEEQFVVPPWYLYAMAGVSHVLVFGVIAATHVKLHLLAAGHLHSSALRSPSAQVLVLLTSCYVVCWAPFLAVLTARQIHRSYDQLLERLFHATFTFTSLNYVLNSFIFSWKNTLVRDAVLDLFSCRRRPGDAALVRPFTTPAVCFKTIT